jgi:hypothetical protein
MTEYDRVVEFLAAGFLVRDRMTPEVSERWRAELHRAIGLRGGLVGDHVDIAVGKDVMAEVAERAMRLFANELTPKLHKSMDDDAVAGVEVELSDTLHRVLVYIEAAKL